MIFIINSLAKIKNITPIETIELTYHHKIKRKMWGSPQNSNDLSYFEVDATNLAEVDTMNKEISDGNIKLGSYSVSEKHEHLLTGDAPLKDICVLETEKHKDSKTIEKYVFRLKNNNIYERINNNLREVRRSERCVFFMITGIPLMDPEEAPVTAAPKYVFYLGKDSKNRIWEGICSRDAGPFKKPQLNIKTPENPSNRRQATVGNKNRGPGSSINGNHVSESGHIPISLDTEGPDTEATNKGGETGNPGAPGPPALEPSFWQNNKVYILISLGVLVLFGGGYAGFTISKRE